MDRELEIRYESTNFFQNPNFLWIFFPPFKRIFQACRQVRQMLSYFQFPLGHRLLSTQLPVTESQLLCPATSPQIQPHLKWKAVVPSVAPSFMMVCCRTASRRGNLWMRHRARLFQFVFSQRGSSFNVEPHQLQLSSTTFV